MLALGPSGQQDAAGREEAHTVDSIVGILRTRRLLLQRLTLLRLRLMLRLGLGTLLGELTLLVEGFGLRDGRHNIVILEVLGVVLPYTLLFQLAKSLSCCQHAPLSRTWDGKVVWNHGMPG